MMMKETCPMFLMGGQSILEVVLVPLTSEDGQVWFFNESAVATGIEGVIDSVVVESPIGCYVMPVHPVRLNPGDTFSLNPKQGGGPGWDRCRRPSSQEAAVSESVEEPVHQ